MLSPSGAHRFSEDPEGVTSVSLGHPSELRQQKILILINSLGGGGSERSLVELVPYFRENGIDPIVVCLKRREGDLAELLRIAGIQVVYLRGRNILGWAFSLRKLIVSEGAALLHTSLFEADLVGRIAGFRTNVSVLTSLVNMSYEPVRFSDPKVTSLKLHATRFLDGWTARGLTTHFHAVTYAVRDSAVKALKIDPTRVTVVERGRDPNRLGLVSWHRRESARKKLGLTDVDEVLVTVGRQEFQKGQKFLLHALGLLLPQRPRLKLLIVGGQGHATEELLTLHNQLGLGDRVVFLGYREDVPEILACADLFVFPSLYEGTGGAAIEAMALGLPIVTTDIPSMREVVEADNSAMLVHPGAPEELAAAITALLSNPGKMKEFGQRGAQIFLERFTLEKSAMGMLKLYSELMERGGSRTR